MTHGDRSRTLALSMPGADRLGADGLGADLFTSEDVDAGRVRMLRVIRQLLVLQPAAGFEAPDDDGDVLDPEQDRGEKHMATLMGQFLDGVGQAVTRSPVQEHGAVGAAGGK